MLPLPNAASLGRWLASWVQPSGAIHGFHNHPIWGTNPWRTLDFSAGHTTFAAPLMMGLADLLSRGADARGRELLQRLVGFQTDAVQESGEYAHVGFQIGEVLKYGLIHNAVPNVALAYVALHARPFLADGQFEAIGGRLRASLEHLDRRYPNAEPRSGTCNQEYARCWSRMLYAQAFGDLRWKTRAREELHQFIRDFHRRGWPDADCAATLRDCWNPLETFEPAEYYGLMIEPLLLGWEIYGDQVFLDEALALSRHIARSAWTDAAGQTRLHRLWGKAGGRYQRFTEPMSICAAGHTAAGILSLLKIQSNLELNDFLVRLNRTYVHYQHPAGFFLSATGWGSELDVAPSTAWHAHDFFYLAQLAEPDARFWDAFFAPDDAGRAAVLLGEQCFYIERGPHWAISSYLTQDQFRLRGRKDRAAFGVEPYDWIAEMTPLDPDLRFPDLPQFWKTDDAIVLERGEPADMDVVSFAGVPFRV